VEAMMEVWQLHQRLSRQLSPNVKLRIRQIVPRYLALAKTVHDPRQLYLQTLSLLKLQFPGASPHEADLLAVYLIGGASLERDRLERDRLAPQLDSVNELGAMDALQLQMMMQRQSRMLTMLSNIMKARADVQNAIIQNIK
jgi:hypothetical protein